MRVTRFVQRGRCRGLASAVLACAIGLSWRGADGAEAGRGEITLELYALQEKHFPPQAGKKPPCILGGKDQATVVLDLNVPLFQRLAVGPDDLREVVLRMKLSGKPAKLDGAKLAFHRMLRPAKGGKPTPGEDYEARPFLSAALPDCVEGGWLAVPGLAPALSEWVAKRWADHGILVRLDAPAAEPPLSLRLVGVSSPGAGYWQRNLPHTLATIRKHENHFLFDWPVKPREGVWCQLKDGHLSYGGKRLRLWGVCRGASHNPLQARRVKKMGFNAIRLWAGSEYSDESAKKGALDTAKMDRYDRYVAEMKRQGMWIMCPTLMRNACGIRSAKKGLFADDSWLAGGSDWGAWKAAVSTKGAPLKFFYYFDERLARSRRRHARNFLQHVNPHTKKRYGEEECIALYEVWNENGFLKWTLERGFGSWPAYFRNKLQKRWNAWLAERYQDAAALTRAWGKLDDGEALDGGTVKLAPLVTQRSKYPEQRGRDFVRFCIELVDKSNQELIAYCRTLAPKGVGVNAAPFSCDTQYRMNTPWLYADSRADVVCFGLYYHQMQSTLTRPPSMGVLDSNTVAGRATVLYEVNTGHPNPYRTEFPVRLAALASWQDWDGVFFHYFQEPLWYWKRLNPDEQYLLQTLPYGFNTADVMIETDPAFCSSSALAAQAFLHHLLAPARKPVTYRVGAKAIFGYDRFNGVGMAHKTFTDGAVVEFRPDLNEGVTVNGQPPPERGRVIGPVASGDQILWDWENGRLIVDAPAVKAYVGKPRPHTFRDGIELSGMTTDFIVFAMASRDGKPLVGPNATRCIRLWAGWNNLNTGYEIDPKMLARKGFVHPGERMKAVRKKGHPPVVADVVPYTLTFPTTLTYRFEGYDFALRKCLRRAGKDTREVRHDGSGLFMALLHVDARGKPAAGPAGGASAQYCPIPGLSWDTGYASAHKALASSKLRFAALSKLDESGKAEKTLSLSEAVALFDSPADVDIAFRDGQMRKIDVSFTQAPPLTEVIAAYEKRLGRPLVKRLAAQVYGTSTVQWRVRSGKATLAVGITDHQGSMKIAFERQ